MIFFNTGILVIITHKPWPLVMGTHERKPCVPSKLILIRCTFMFYAFMYALSLVDKTSKAPSRCSNGPCVGINLAVSYTRLNLVFSGATGNFP